MTEQPTIKVSDLRLEWSCQKINGFQGGGTLRQYRYYLGDKWFGTIQIKHQPARYKLEIATSAGNAVVMGSNMRWMAEANGYRLTN